MQDRCQLQHLGGGQGQVIAEYRNQLAVQNMLPAVAHSVLLSRWAQAELVVIIGFERQPPELLSHVLFLGCFHRRGCRWLLASPKRVKSRLLPPGSAASSDPHQRLGAERSEERPCQSRAVIELLALQNVEPPRPPISLRLRQADAVSLPQGEHQTQQLVDGLVRSTSTWC